MWLVAESEFEEELSLMQDEHDYISAKLRKATIDRKAMEVSMSAKDAKYQQSAQVTCCIMF